MSGGLVPVIVLVVVLLVGAAAVLGVMLGRSAHQRAQDRWVDPMLLFGEADAFPGPKARRWAYGVLYEAGVDADADPRYAAEVLCSAEPALHPDHARALVRLMA